MDIEIIMHVPKHAINLERLKLNEKQYALLFYTYSGYALVIWPALFSLEYLPYLSGAGCSKSHGL